MFSRPDEDERYKDDPYYPIAKACRHLADADLDDASEVNGIGYNKIDGKFGKDLARKPWNQWTPRMKQAVYSMLKRYREQLRNYFGIDYTAIPSPAVLTASRQVDSAATQQREAQGEERRSARPQADPYKWIQFSPEDPNQIEIEFKNVSKEEFAQIHAAIKLFTEARFLTEGGTPNPNYEEERRHNTYAKRWSVYPTRSYWTVPLNPSTAVQVNELARTFKFRAPAEVIRRVKEIADQANKMEAVSKMVADDFDVPGFGNPEKGLAPLPFQRAGMRYVIEGTKQALIADDMGLGKTIQALGILFGLRAFPALIVVPKVVLINWQREILKWCPGVKPMIVNSRITAEEIQREEPDIVLINYDILKAAYPQLAMIQWNAVAADEAHRAKNPGAQRSQALKALMKDVTIRLLLTGTPIENRPTELMTLLKILGTFHRMWRTDQEFYSNHWWNNQLQNAMQLHDLLRRTCMVRRRKEDVLKELPPIRRTMVPVELENVKEYEYAEKNLLSWVYQEAAKDEEFLASVAHLPQPERDAAIRAYQNDKVMRARRAMALVRIEKLKQLSVRGKWKAFLEWLDEQLESGQKIVIMATHRKVQHELKKRYPNAATIFGGMKGEDRQAEQDRFMNDPECQLAICAMKAAGEGITLTSAHQGVFIEFGWTPTGHAQCEARIHRIGQTMPVNWYYFAGVRESGEETIDEWIFELVDKKMQISRSIIDGVEVLDDNESLGASLWKKLAEKSKDAKDLPENPVFDDETDKEVEGLDEVLETV